MAEKTAVLIYMLLFSRERSNSSPPNLLVSKTLLPTKMIEDPEKLLINQVLSIFCVRK